jgi:hypothetical protein
MVADTAINRTRSPQTLPQGDAFEQPFYSLPVQEVLRLFSRNAVGVFIIDFQSDTEKNRAMLELFRCWSSTAQ